MTTARAVTGVTGAYLSRGFDRADMFVDPGGERIKVEEREVSFIGEYVLEDVLYSFDSKDARIFERFSMLANRVQFEEDIPLDTVVGLYASGTIREVRVGKKKFRSQGSMYYGKIN